MLLTEYMARLDSDDPASALEVMEPDLEFLLVLPGGQVRGHSREDFAAYISRRSAAGRVHNVVRQTTDRDVEFVYGVVTENGEWKGAFLSAGVVSPARRLQRYLSFFDTSFAVIDWPSAES